MYSEGLIVIGILLIVLKIIEIILLVAMYFKDSADLRKLDRE